MAKSKKQHDLLADLDALPPKTPNVFEFDNIDPMAEPYPTLPLWRRVDRQFWWNEWLAKPLVDSGLHSYILPIMQGYYQTASFHVPDPQDTEGEGILIDYAIVSRRSRDRAGLRYQRRGIDDDAHVANFVESEAVVRVEVRPCFAEKKSPSLMPNFQRDGSTNIFSYVQIRGSSKLYLPFVVSHKHHITIFSSAFLDANWIWIETTTVGFSRQDTRAASKYDEETF